MSAVAIWSSSDLAGLGDQLLPRVVERELLARLPGWRMNLFAPFGWERPSAADGGVVAEPLGAHSPARAAEIAASATLSVLCPGFPVGLDGDELARRYGDERAAAIAPFFSAGLEPIGHAGVPRGVLGHVGVPRGDVAGDGDAVELERLGEGRPVVLCGVRVASGAPAELAALGSRAPVVSVRDAVSRDRLGGAEDVAVVPHPALLLDGVVDLDTLPVRRQQLRQLGVLPDAEAYAVLALGEAAAPDHAELGEALAAAEADALVVLPVSGGAASARGRPTMRLRARGTPTWQGTPTFEGAPPDALPAELVLEDRLAVLAGARVVIATEEHAAAAAAGLGVPWALLDPSGEHRPVAAVFGDERQVVESVAELAAAVRLAREAPAPGDGARAALAVHFDRIAEVAERALRDAGAEPHRPAGTLAAENAALRQANQRLRQRMVVERQRLADALAPVLREGDAATAELAGVRADNDRLNARVAELAARVAEYERELQAWQNTKLVRWTKPLREVYAKRLNR